MTLGLVLLAAYASTCVTLSMLLIVACRAGLTSRLRRPAQLLGLRLLPTAAAALFTMTIVLPAFLIYEPPHDHETIGPVLWVLAVLSLLMLGDGLRRGACGWLAGRALWREFAMRADFKIGAWAGRRVAIVDVAQPMVAVVGAWRPRIVAARRVLAACTEEEFQQVVAHETAHLASRDNLKGLLLALSPDPLAWLPAGAALTQHWRTAIEFAADAHATGSDPRRRVALASALIKVARLATASDRPLPVFAMSVAADDVAGRVRQLLAPEVLRPQPTPPWSAIVRALAVGGLLLPLAAVPIYAPLHELIEFLVGVGR